MKSFESAIPMQTESNTPAHPEGMTEIRKPMPEAPFKKIPDARPEIAEQIERDGGWTGFRTPFTSVLSPLFFGLENRDRSDLVLVDMGCGWGEHTALAGIGMKGYFPQVKEAIGVGLDPEEIRMANIMGKLAIRDPYFFRRVMDNADKSIGLSNIGSPTVDSFKGVLRTPELCSELERLLDANDEEGLQNFLNMHIPDRRKGLPKYMRDPRKQIDADIRYIQGDICHPPLPDNYADRMVSASVAGYIEEPENERAMWENMLRITKPGGIINVISFEYMRDGKTTSGPEELKKVADSLGIKLELDQKRDMHIDGPNPHWIRHSIFDVVEKPVA